MPTREDIVKEARSWIGTPFTHQGRARGVGVDCAGVVEMVPKALKMPGYIGAVIEPYMAQPDPRVMQARLKQYLDAISFNDVLPGDVLLFRLDLDGQHLGVVTTLEPLIMVHAFGRAKIMRCVEQRVAGFWRTRLVGCFRYRGLD